MSGTPPTTASETPETYPHLGTILVATGSGATAFAAAVDGAIPAAAKGFVAAFGVGCVSSGLFLLGRASV